MSTSAKLDQITDFPSLIHYLRGELEWEIPDDAAFKELTFSWTPSEVGLELNEPIEITQLRPLRADQPWGIFFLNFPHAKLPVTVMRRILRGLSKRQRASANAGDKAAWDKDDLLFISAVGEADDRRLSFAHFQDRGKDLPALRVIGWDHDDTVRRLSHVDQLLHEKLAWPDRGVLAEAWRDQWRSAFTERPRESVRTAKAMAEALAALARDIRDRIRLILPKEKPNGDLRKLFEAVKQTLSNDLDTDKFADTYAQTIAYGLLSARINQVRERDAKHKQTQQAQLAPKPALPQITADAAGKAMPTTNPFLRELFGSFLSAGGRDGEGSGLDFDELGVGEVVDLLNAADMEAVLMDFDKQKAGDDPVIHFYEGFLQAYDKALKVQRGVFYTPRPVVSFIVRSVDEVLRTEFGLEDGLADTTTWAEFVANHPEAKTPEGVKGDEPFVKILDPATGTGTFLVEVIELIHDRLVAKWKKAGLDYKARLDDWNAWVPKYLLPRLYGFELMMAPYAVAHMKIGLKLADTGYRFEGLEPDGKPARARIYLANALEPARDLDMQLSFMSDALAHEASAANHAKGKEQFTVVLGNPPYSGVSENQGAWIQGLLKGTDGSRQARADYYSVNGEKLIERKLWLQDDYVKFIRLAHWQLEKTRFGIVGFITNNSYLDGPTYRGMRDALLNSFPSAQIINLNGSAKRDLAHGADENVFDIQQGVAISIWSNSGRHASTVKYADLFGRQPEKYNCLAGSVSQTKIEPGSPWFWLVPRNESNVEYQTFPSVKDIYLSSSTSVQTSRDGFSVGFEDREIIERVSDLETKNATEIFAKYDLQDGRNFSLESAISDIRSDADWRNTLTPYLYRSFDIRRIIYRDSLVNWPRRDVMNNMRYGNVALLIPRQLADEEYRHVFLTQQRSDMCALSGATKEAAQTFPLWLLPRGAEGVRPNLSLKFTARLAKLTSLRFEERLDAPAPVSLGAALDPPPPAQGGLHLPRERGDLKATFGVRDVFDWIYVLLHSPAYRERYADFLKSDFARIPLPKDRALFAELIPLGTELVALHLLDADAAPILADPKVRFVNPGNVEPRLDGRKIAARRNAAGRVHLNDGCWFETVPESVWNHWIGGYQPAQKWLKDRAVTGGAKAKPGRILTSEDQLHYRRMIVALARTAELMAEIDKVITKHGGWPDAFRGMTDE
jgi:hypothetical protein